MLKSVKHAMQNVGDGTGYFTKRVGTSTTEFAKRVGSSTADLAKRIGPKRAIIGAAVLSGIAIGSVLLVRYLRARREELPFEAGEEQEAGRGVRRRARRGAEAQFSH